MRPAAVACSPLGAEGGVVSGVAGTTALDMSVAISVWASARLYTRTSSIRPWKYSPYGRLPPIDSGLELLWTAPVAARDDASVPLTYSRSALPS